ncbi:MAG: PTS sugar transporter subunit IIA, partial [Planctomycetaceae bacterium]|nr:PTS sugar transporter subunit IIA [Planctomycetaceae bacterium]
MQFYINALNDDAFLLDLDASSLDEVFSATLDHLVTRDMLDLEHREIIREALWEREKIASTAIGQSVSIPHAYVPEIKQSLVFFVRLRKPINLGAPDGIPTRFFFILLGPNETESGHLDTLTQIARLMSDDEFRYDISQAKSRKDLIDSLSWFIKRNTVQPEHREIPASEDGLAYTGRFFGGVRQDYARRIKHYRDDWSRGWSGKSFAAIIFLFFACLAPAVTFGGIMGVITDQHIGVVEMLIATAIGGMLFAMFCGQPLILLGGVGPMLVFTGILYELCLDLEIPFLPMYQWIGFWTALILLLLAAFDASCLMRYFTRFSDEVFSALMSLMFIYEAVKALVIVFHESYGNDSVHYDRAFLSMILAIGTFSIALNLSRFRRSRYLLPKMREFLSDFGPTIAISIMAMAAFFFRNEIQIDQLAVPDSIRPTFTEIQTGAPRSWIIDGSQLSIQLKLFAILPACLAAVLIFLVQNVTSRLVNNPDLKLKKGTAYHLDLTVIAVLVGFCSLFGLPWLVAATVRSLAHVRGLATVDDVLLPSGDTKERVIHVEENRLTAFAIHALIGLSLVALSLLAMTPMAVLFGLFLFMGVVSLSGNQFIERLNLWVMDSSLYPRTHYIRRVPIRTIHIFTLAQFCCLLVLCLINLSPVKWMRL